MKKKNQESAQNAKAHIGIDREKDKHRQGTLIKFKKGLNMPRKRKGKKMKTIDLFAGVGGIRIGFEKAGFETAFANDFDKTCKDTYDRNFSAPKLDTRSIWDIPIKELPEFDLLLGGFPCQAFSIAGYRKGFKDEKGRGNLFFRIAEILEEKTPKAFLLENVKNLRGHDNGKTFAIIQKTLSDLGYHTKEKVLNSMTHANIPQNRERIFIVGFRDKKQCDKFEFPEQIPLTRSFRDFTANEADDKYYYNDKPLYKRIKDDINSEETVYQWRRQYVRTNKKGVVPTLTANMGTGGHNVPIIKNHKGIRKLTPKECFLLQGFPEKFKLGHLADSKLYHQAGNSVTVPLIERIATQMKMVLD
ncbi:Modification methylase MthTI [uncultured archaeon]|nr:Modification methylase MthTI [uncultured archaeon]